MAKAGKRIKQLRKGLEHDQIHPLDGALSIVKKAANAKFDETIEVAITLGVDARKSDQMVRGTSALPQQCALQYLLVMLRQKKQSKLVQISWVQMT
jgi:large subunit ribosomal protein L1